MKKGEAQSGDTRKDPLNRKTMKKSIRSSRRGETYFGETKTAGFPIVGMGASAGGLEAFEQFFSHMSSDSGMAFVLVPHLDPSHASMMTDLIKRFTKMNVIETEDGIQVESDHCM